MKKNVAGQAIGAQMISATDGSAFTGAVTAYVCGDAGAQAAGSVGAGACVHEGNGYHTYAPAQAETNYDLIAFTFTGSGAIPATVQVVTDFPQTGDSFARIGVAGAGLTAIAAAGAGAITWTYTLTSSVTGLPIADADVWVTSDAAGANVLASGRTNANGVVTFYLDAAAAIYVWRQKSGWNFSPNPDTEAVV